MYLAFITFSLVIAYFIFFALFPLFFRNSLLPFNGKSLLSIVYIIFFSFFSYLVAFAVSDEQISNRILHSIGGGFAAFLVCFLVVKDTRLQINKFQFLVFSYLLVMSLGVANEIMEFILQNYFDFLFSPTLNDTWLDLVSNAVGALIAAIGLTPFVSKK